MIISVYWFIWWTTGHQLLTINRLLIWQQTSAIIPSTYGTYTYFCVQYKGERSSSWVTNYWRSIFHDNFEFEDPSHVRLIIDAKVDQILKLWLLCYRFGMRRVSVDQLIEAAMLAFLVRLWIPSSFVPGRGQQGWSISGTWEITMIMVLMTNMND